MSVTNKLLQERVSMIYSNALAANLLVIFISCLFSFFVRADAGTLLFVFAWSLIMVLIALGRLYLYHSRRINPGSRTDWQWLRIYTLVTAAAGVCWALLMLLVIWENHSYNTVLIYVMLAAVQMMAVPVLSVVKPAFYFYTLPSALMMIFLPLWVNSIPLYMSAGSFFWAIVVQVMGDNFYRRMTQIFSLEFENQSLEDEIQKRKKVEHDLSYLAHHDALTDLPNRLLLGIRLQHAIETARRYKNHKLAVLFIDLDNFKKINDSLGHEAGDSLLQQLGERFKAELREGDTVARLGGDEFIIVAEHMSGIDAIERFVEKIMALMKMPFVIEGNKLYVSCSTGISVYPDDGQTQVDLIKNADAAMYRAKELGKNGYHFYTSDLTTLTIEQITLENDLRIALETGQIIVFYQVQVCLKSNTVSGVEALVRWQHPQRGLLAPDSFLSIAEESGLIVRLGEEVLRQACTQMVLWKKSDLAVERVAVNLAGAQLRTTELLLLVDNVCRSTGCKPQWLEFEVIEDFIMNESFNVIALLERLKNRGIVLSIDDFGTGYSSLSRLKQLPIHKLKIDKSFIRDIEHDADDAAIVRAIIALGKTLNLKILAEGVENQYQIDLLLAEGCHNVQGFFYSKPVDASEVAAIVHSLENANHTHKAS